MTFREASFPASVLAIKNMAYQRLTYLRAYWNDGKEMGFLFIIKDHPLNLKSRLNTELNDRYAALLLA